MPNLSSNDFIVRDNNKFVVIPAAIPTEKIRENKIKYMSFSKMPTFTEQG